MKKSADRADRERKRAVEQLTRSEWLVYAGKLMLAQNAFESGNGGLVMHYLEECQANLRGWEHRYLWTRINARQTLAGHAHEVWSVAFSPDGRRIVTGSRDKTAKVWDAATGRGLLALEGHTGWVNSVAFSPDGQRIVTGAGDSGHPGINPTSEAKVWDAATGREFLTLKGHTVPVLSVTFSPDGRRIVTGAGDHHKPGEAKVWDAETGRELLALEGHASQVYSVAFSPDGRRIVTGSQDQAKVWDAETGRELLALKGHAGGVRRRPSAPTDDESSQAAMTGRRRSGMPRKAGRSSHSRGTQAGL